jgi:hypothetical protein
VALHTAQSQSVVDPDTKYNYRSESKNRIRIHPLTSDQESLLTSDQVRYFFEVKITDYLKI